MPDAVETAVIDAYERFFAAFNSRDARAWSDALSFPHVRVSAHGTPQVIHTREAHIESAGWERVTATGWDHSEGKPGVLLHVSHDAAHVLGGWTRYAKDGRKILDNTVAYVITRGGDRWGVQARFGIDAGADGDDEVEYARAVELVEEYLDAYNDRDWARAATFFDYPTFLVEPGVVRHWNDAESFAPELGDVRWHLLTEKSARAVQGSANAVNVAVEVVLDGGDRKQQALFLVTRRDEAWGIRARSVIEASA